MHLIIKAYFSKHGYLIIFSFAALNAIIRENNGTLRKYFYLIIGLHTICTIIRIGLLCIYRRTRTFHHYLYH